MKISIPQEIHISFKDVLLFGVVIAQGFILYGLSGKLEILWEFCKRIASTSAQ